jgi:hypothetical protein
MVRMAREKELGVLARTPRGSAGHPMRGRLMTYQKDEEFFHAATRVSDDDRDG